MTLYIGCENKKFYCQLGDFTGKRYYFNPKNQKSIIIAKYKCLRQSVT